MNKQDLEDILYSIEKCEHLTMSIPDELEDALDEFTDYVRKLQHFKDSTCGLWATDKEPKDKTNFFRIN